MSIDDLELKSGFDAKTKLGLLFTNWLYEELWVTQIFFKRANPGLFLFISFFSNQNFTEKTVNVRRIRTRIVRAEGEHADHSTTSPRPKLEIFYYTRKF